MAEADKIQGLESNCLVPNNTSSEDNLAQNTQVDHQQAQPAGIWAKIKPFAIQLLIMYFVANLFRRSWTPVNNHETVGGHMSTNKPGSNLFEKGCQMDMYVYVSEYETFEDFRQENDLVWVQKGLVYGDWESGPHGDGSFDMSVQIQTTDTMQSNGSIYLHVYFVKEGKSPDPADRPNKMYSKKYTVYMSRCLNKFKKRHFHSSVNLLTGTTDVHPDLIRKSDQLAFEVLSHWHPNLTINLLDDHTPWTQGSIPLPLDEYIEFYPGTNNYYPVIFLNDYWNMNSDYSPINQTVRSLNLTLTFSPISLWKWQLYVGQSTKNKWTSMLGMDPAENSNDNDQDTLKVAFLETSLYLLALTIVVSILHSVFEFLAFKNDIQFWRSRKSLEGLSVRSVFFNVFQSLIVLLYILDNETNTVVKISIFVGLCIDLWKIHKVVNVKRHPTERTLGLFPRVEVELKSTYTESSTKEFDKLAFRYMSWALYPLLVGYAVYSLLYLEHRGWYSWLLNMLYGFLLTFGFIMMTPQLFINYKMKSVAHLPWRMLSYKALNTFIDDMFAFVIKMPTLYRIGCLRDDVIFFVYMYQRWIYRIDPKRINEFGTSLEMTSNGTVPAVGTAQVNHCSQDNLNTEPECVEDSRNKSDMEKKKD